MFGLAWFFPLFTGSSFSDVPAYESSTVYPWAAHKDGVHPFPQSDQAALNYPVQAELTADLRHGTIPWWNSDSFAGQPLYADGSSALLYPPRLLLAATVSPTTAHNVLSVFDVILAGLFTYWLLVDLGLSPLAALFGAVAWMFGSFTLGWLQLEVVAPVFAWLPAGLVTMRRSILRSWRWVVGAASCIAMLFVSTHILFAAIAMVAICLYGACLAITEFVSELRKGSRWRSCAAPARGLSSALLGFGLAGFVLVPTAALLGGISRHPLSLAEITKEFLLPLSDLRYIIWPISPPITSGKMQSCLAFVGTLTACCGAVGLCLRRRGSGLGRGLILGSLLVAIGGPVTFLAYTLIPGMNVFRPYSRLLFIFDLGVAILGAVGLDAVIGAIAGKESGATRVSDSPAPRWYARHPRRWYVSRCVALAVIGITALQLGVYGREINPPFLPSNQYPAFPVNPLIRRLEAPNRGVAGWPNRVLPLSDGRKAMLYSDDALVFGIDNAGGYESAVPTRTVALWRVVHDVSPAVAATTKLQQAYQLRFNVPHLRYYLLPRLGVDQLALGPNVAGGRSLISEIESLGWKRVYRGSGGSVFDWTGAPTGPVVVFNAEYDNRDLAALEAFTNAAFDYQHEVILDRSGQAGTWVTGTGIVTFARRGVNTAEVAVQSSKSGWLVIPDMWDPGWSATVNGRAVPVERSDFNEQAVAIPAGKALVQLRYSPVGLTDGVAVSVVSASACTGILAWPLLLGMRRRRTRVTV